MSPGERPKQLGASFWNGLVQLMLAVVDDTCSVDLVNGASHSSDVPTIDGIANDFGSYGSRE